MRNHCKSGYLFQPMTTSHLLPLFHYITAFLGNLRNFVAKEVGVFMTSHSFLSTQQGLTNFFCGLSKDRPSI